MRKTVTNIVEQDGRLDTTNYDGELRVDGVFGGRSRGRSRGGEKWWTVYVYR